MLESLRTYLAYPFVRYALVAGVMIALCSSLLGVTLVLKRFSLIGDGLSHVAFGALAVASVLRLTAPMIFVLPATVLCAVALLCASQNSRIRGDASIAMDERDPKDVKIIADFVQRHAPGMKISLAGNKKPSEFKVDEELAKKWLNDGAQPTETVARIFKTVGISK